ncbi:MAG: ABC transporter ATP-binding protein [Gammaproteobacteria bacterium]
MPIEVTSAPLLEVRQLSLHYGGVVALHEVSFELAAGELIGLIGPNGAGKTSAFNAISGVVKPTRGAVIFAEQDLTRASPQARARAGMTRTFQNIRLFAELTVLENVMAGAHQRHGAGLLRTLLGGAGWRRQERLIAERAQAALKLVALQDKAGRRADELSYGEQRRVEIARALASEPRLLLLDEPTAGMNDRETRELGDLIESLFREQGIAVILVEHNVQLVASLCPRLVVLSKGEYLAAGPPAQVLSDPAVIEAYLGRRQSPSRAADSYAHAADSPISGGAKGAENHAAT